MKISDDYSDTETYVASSDEESEDDEIPYDEEEEEAEEINSPIYCLCCEEQIDRRTQYVCLNDGEFVCEGCEDVAEVEIEMEADYEAQQPTQ